METATILIVSDDCNSRACMEEIFQQHGYITVSSDSGKKAIGLLSESDPFCAIIEEYATPDMSGAEFCKAVKGDGAHDNIAIIIASGNSDRRSIAKAFKSGADDFFYKPFQLDELLASVEERKKEQNSQNNPVTGRKDLELIADITRKTAESLDSHEILYFVVKKLADFVKADRCSILLIRKENEGSILASHDDPGLSDYRIDLKKYPEVKKALETREPIIINDMPTNPLLDDDRDRIKNLSDTSLMIIPIGKKDDVVGTLQLRVRRKGSAFTSREIDLCKTVANASYYALKNVRLIEDLRSEREQLHEMSITDQLTGLYNHDYFFNRIDEEFNRVVRYKLPLSLLMIDLDDFKLVNDTYGHLVGDNVLRSVSDILQKMVRKTDIVSRYGGEEFTVILPLTDFEGAREEAERIRESIFNHKFPDIEGLSISASIGVISYPNHDIKKSEDIIGLADTALYKAKRSGKNRVIVADRVMQELHQ